MEQEEAGEQAMEQVGGRRASNGAGGGGSMDSAIKSI